LLNELLNMFGGDSDEDEADDQCCQGRQRRQPRAGGVRGLISRLIDGDDDDDADDRRGEGRCCSGAARDGDSRDPDRTGGRRDRDERDDGFDLGD